MNSVFSKGSAIGADGKVVVRLLYRLSPEAHLVRPCNLQMTVAEAELLAASLLEAAARAFDTTPARAAKDGCTPCAEGRCYAHCHVTPDGKHAVDEMSASSHEAGNALADERMVIDFRCRECHATGSVSIKKADVVFE